MRKLFFLFLIIGIVYVSSEVFLDNFAKNYIEKKGSNIVERKLNIDDLKINFINQEIILEDVTIQNNKNFPGDLLKIKKIRILINANTLMSETVEAKIIEIDGIDFYYQVLVKNGQVIDNLSLINQALKAINNNKVEEKKIYPKKKKDKNFIIKKLILKNSNANVISKELKINTKTKLSNMEFLNVGNSKRANHFKDVFAMILTNVISKVQNDILTQKIQQKFENKLKNLKQDILKDLLKENPKDLLKKFDKLFK
jgi:exonuclease I